MKNGEKLILNPSPISNFIGNSLFCSHFLIFPLPALVLRSPFPVPRFSKIPRQRAPKNAYFITTDKYRFVQKSFFGNVW